MDERNERTKKQIAYSSRAKTRRGEGKVTAEAAQQASQSNVERLSGNTDSWSEYRLDPTELE